MNVIDELDVYIDYEYRPVGFAVDDSTPQLYYLKQGDDWIVLNFEDLEELADILAAESECRTGGSFART